MIREIPYVAIIFVMILSCSVSRNKTNSSYKYKSRKSNNSKTSDASLADKIIWSAFKYKGTRYKYGGTTKKGIDCSGLVMVSFAERGINLPRSSYQMATKGYYVSLRKAKRGDLIFFKTNPRNKKRISHVGIVTHIKPNGDVQFIHASTKRGVVLNRTSENYYKRAFAGVRRVLK